MIIIMNHDNHQIKTHLIAAGESIAYTLVRFPVKHHLTPISIIISPPTNPKKNLQMQPPVIPTCCPLTYSIVS